MHHWRDATWRLETRLGAPHTRYDWAADRPASSAAFRVWVRHLWYTRWLRWRHRAVQRPWTRAWLGDAMCVHHYEGAWTDPGAPYWGGLQMDLAFQAAYGRGFLERWGTADHWPPRDQLVAAWRAWRVRGWSPWPNTAAMCGLA